MQLKRGSASVKIASTSVPPKDMYGIAYSAGTSLTSLICLKTKNQYHVTVHEPHHEKTC